MILVLEILNLGYVGEDGLDFEFTSVDFLFSWFFHSYATHSLRWEVGLLFFLIDATAGYSRRVVFFFAEIFLKFRRLSEISWVSLACVLSTCVGLTFLFSVSWGFGSS